MEDPSRPRLVALVVLLAISAAFVAIALGSQDDGGGQGGGGGQPAGLRLEPSAQDVPTELTIYLEDRGANVLTTTQGSRQVTVECLNSAGRVTFRTREPWPFTGTDSGQNAPHIHMQMDPSILDRIVRCRLKDTDPALEGPKP